MTEIEARLNWRGWEVEMCVDGAYFRYTGDDKKSAEIGANWIQEQVLDAFSEDETLPIEKQTDLCKYAYSVAVGVGEIMKNLAALYDNPEEG